jgi:hypothetical protein
MRSGTISRSIIGQVQKGAYRTDKGGLLRFSTFTNRAQFLKGDRTVGLGVNVTMRLEVSYRHSP